MSTSTLHPSILFILVPVNTPAQEIVDYRENSHFKRTLGLNGIPIGLIPSKRPGKLVTLGTRDDMDIRLPYKPLEANYRKDHCNFFLAEQSGELILRDESREWDAQCTEIKLMNGTEEEIRLQQMPKRAMGHDLIQRVIPKSDKTRKVHIILRTYPHVTYREAEFRLEWNKEVALTQPEILIKQGRDLAKKGGPATRPADDIGAVVRQQRLGVSEYPVSVCTRKSEAKPAMEVHQYETLGQGTFGTVSKVVDYKNGDVWAMKVIRPISENGVEMVSVLQEIQVLKTLEHHDNIVHFERYQDCRAQDKTFRLFFKLCQGNINHLLASENYHHNCSYPPTPPFSPSPSWTEYFMKDVLSALSYLHQKGFTHHDIKPGNILFDTINPEVSQQDGTPARRHTFYLADFGLSTGETNQNPLSSQVGQAAGTYIYMAPEIWRGTRDKYQPPTWPRTRSDIWSLGITLGTVLGVWCDNEMNLSLEEWVRKLAVFHLLHLEGQDNITDEQKHQENEKWWKDRQEYIEEEEKMRLSFRLLFSEFMLGSGQLTATQQEDQKQKLDEDFRQQRWYLRIRFLLACSVFLQRKYPYLQFLLSDHPLMRHTAEQLLTI